MAVLGRRTNEHDAAGSHGNAQHKCCPHAAQLFNNSGSADRSGFTRSGGVRAFDSDPNIPREFRVRVMGVRNAAYAALVGG